jgi:hypothetical protein
LFGGWGFQDVSDHTIIKRQLPLRRSYNSDACLELSTATQRQANPIASKVRNFFSPESLRL